MPRAYLFRLSLEGMIFAYGLPWFWAALLVLAVAALWALRGGRVRAVDRGYSAELLLPFVFPIAIVLWASAFFGSLANEPEGWHWQELGVFGFLVAQAAVGAGLVIRHRSRLWFTLAICVTAIWWAAGASFLAGMALADDWL